jgi:hypothetical protein
MTVDPPAPSVHAHEFMLLYSLQTASELQERLERLGTPLVYEHL